MSQKSLQLLLLLAVCVGAFALIGIVGWKVVRPRGGGNGKSGAVLDHHENAALIGEDRESVEIARKAPLTSDKGAADSSFESEEVHRLLEGELKSPIQGRKISSQEEPSGFSPYGNDIGN